MSTAGWVVGGVVVGGVLYLALSGKKKAAEPAKPAPLPECPAGQVRNPVTKECVEVPGEQQECPTGEVWDGAQQQCVPNEMLLCPEDQFWDKVQQKCVPKVPGGGQEVTNLSDDQAVLLEGTGLWSIIPAEVEGIVEQLASAGRPTTGLASWAVELSIMSDPEKAYYSAALLNQDPAWKVRAAGWLAKQGWSQAAANMLALSVVTANPSQQEKIAAVAGAAEKGAKAVYGGDVLGFVVATEELRAFMATDTAVVKDSYEYLTGAGGYGMMLVSKTDGLLKYYNELNLLPQAIRDTMRHEIDTGDTAALASLVSGTKLTNFPQTRAQLDFLSKLSFGMDMKPLVPTIRDLAEEGV